MKVKFKEDTPTMNYGLCEKGAVVNVSTKDGKAFIQNQKAKAVKTQEKK